MFENWLLMPLQRHGQQLHHKQLEIFFMIQIFKTESFEKKLFISETERNDLNLEKLTLANH